MESLNELFRRVTDAAERLRGVAHVTPVVTSRWLDERLGAAVFLKCESFQRIGAFKFRGAYNAISRLSGDEQRRGVVTFSSGNHAQGVALAGRLLGVAAVVVMPLDAPVIKREAPKATAPGSCCTTPPNAAARRSHASSSRSTATP